MTLNIRNGLVQINETSEDRIINFHLKRGFAMLTAFRSEYTLAENRNRNRQLASELKALGYSYTKVTGGYVETITKDNPNWDDADIISNDSEHRQLPIMEESFLVPMFDVKTKQVVVDYNSFKKDMVDLGIEFEQDSVLVSPPEGQGKPAYIVTNNRSGEVGSTDFSFDSLTVAGVADTYFSMKEKSINKARRKRKQGVGGVKFESIWLDEPAHTISGVRARDQRNEIAPFGSHYYNSSSLNKKSEDVVESLVTKLENKIKARKYEVKSWQVKQIEDIMAGNDSLVKTWAIMTAENPMGNKQGVHANKDSLLNLKRSLKARGYDYIPVKGMYGNLENSLFIINPTLSDITKLSRQFNQESFIFAVSKGGYFDMSYYEKKAAPDAPYNVTHSRSNVIDMSDAEDFFTSVKSHSKRAFKFQIPFFDDTDAEFESLHYLLNKYMVEHYGYQGIAKLKSMIAESFNKKYNTMHNAAIRAKIYETYEKRCKRCLKLVESLKSAIKSSEDKEYIKSYVESINSIISTL